MKIETVAISLTILVLISVIIIFSQQSFVSGPKETERYFEYYGPDGYVEYDIDLDFQSIIDTLNNSNYIDVISVSGTQSTLRIQLNYTGSVIPVDNLTFYYNSLTIFKRDCRISIRCHYSTPFPIDGKEYSIDNDTFWKQVEKQYCFDRKNLETYFFTMLDEIEELLNLQNPEPSDLRISNLYGL